MTKLIIYAALALAMLVLDAVSRRQQRRAAARMAEERQAMRPTFAPASQVPVTTLVPPVAARPVSPAAARKPTAAGAAAAKPVRHPSSAGRPEHGHLEAASSATPTLPTAAPLARPALDLDRRAVRQGILMREVLLGPGGRALDPWA